MIYFQWNAIVGRKARNPEMPKPLFARKHLNSTLTKIGNTNHNKIIMRIFKELGTPTVCFNGDINDFTL